MKFRFSSDFVVDSDVEPWRREGLRIAMLGGPGSGKSWNNSLVAEQFLQQGGTVVIFQPRDEYFTLKEKFDVLSVGGVHAKDMEFALTSPSLYAKAVVEDGISMIFYTSAVDDEQKLIDWVSRFISLVLRYQEQHRRPLLLILEEAHEYVPKSPSGHVAPPWVYNRMVKAFKDCFTQGRKLNIIAVASSQRPQELNFTIRQLANLTFYGKFSNQDIKYIEKECLQYVRKQFEMKGNEAIVRIIDSSRLLDLKLGEWLVIMGKETRFIKVTEKRVTKHGAETPRLEYVAPRPTEAKKTIDELSKSILAALEKEEAEQSELEKTKRKLHETEEKLKAAEKKADIKVSVKEMFSEDKPVGVMTPSALSKEDKESKEKLAKKIEFLELKEKNYKEQLERAEKDLKAYDELRTWLRIALNIQNIYDNIHKVEEKIPTALPTALPTGNREVGLQHTTTIIGVQPVEKNVTVNTEIIRGKILALGQSGFLNAWHGLGDIYNALIEKFSWTVAKSSLQVELSRMVDEFLLGAKEDKGRGQRVYRLAEDVKFKEVAP
jgi:hypothetical protein